MAERKAGLTIRPVDVDTWAELETLFEARGGPHYCWCTAWRTVPKSPTGATPATRKAAKKATLKNAVDGGLPVGIVGLLDGEPAAWCAVAPRECHRRLRPDQDSTESGVWSITCFYLPRRLRGLGLSSRMLDAAVEYATRSGATVVEAYPVAPASPSYRFMGLIEQFERAGFSYSGSAGAMRLTCAPAGLRR